VKPTSERILMVVALVVCVGGSFALGRSRAADAPGVRQAPAVVMAVRDIAHLDTTSFHIEKVVEVTDAQSRLWGLVEAKDALLLVAVGDVVAGVDLAKIHDEDVSVDSATRTVHVRLPAAEVTSSTLDELATHVYKRSTDVLARRNERLEGDAHRDAEEQMRKAAIEAGILDRARTGAERTLQTLLRSLGYDRVELYWADRG
jgi:hypothetical protein